MPDRVLSIEVDGIYLQPPRKNHDRFVEAIGSVLYSTVNEDLRVGIRSYGSQYRQTDSTSRQAVYKVKDVPEARFPGGKLGLCPTQQPPTHAPLEWNVITEEGDAFLNERILPHVLGGLSCTILGAAGVGKTWVLKKVAEALEAQGQQVKKISLAHVAARLIEGTTVHNFLARYVFNGSFKGTILLDEILSLIHI